jgi:hypothetical protein
VRTWLTPARTPCVPCAPQLPVARLYLRPFVTVPLLMAKGRLISLPLSTARCTYDLTSLHSFLQFACTRSSTQARVGVKVS